MPVAAERALDVAAEKLASIKVVVPGALATHLTVWYNESKKKNKLLDSCYELRCYSIFVQKVREGIQNGLELRTAIRQAITYCQTHDLMGDYFQKNESEVFDMVNFKWNQKRALEVAKEDGISIGTHNAMMNVALNLLKQGIPMKVITDSTKLSLDEVRKIAKDNGLAF